jgi:vancomycin resistance protein VanJ
LAIETKEPTKPKAKKRRPLKEKKSYTLEIVMAVNIALLVLIWWLETNIAEHFWLTTALTYAPQWPFALPTLVLIVVALSYSKKLLTAINLATALLLCYAILGFQVTLSRAALPLPSLRVMTYNIEHAEGGVDAVANVISKEYPDVVCLDEVNKYGAYQDPTPWLQRLLPKYRFVRYDEILIASRFPILETQVCPLQPSSKRRPALRAVVDVHGRKVTIFATHFDTSISGDSLSPHLHSLHGITSIPSYLEDTAKAREVQASGLLKWVAKTNTPVVVAGDFNTPPRGLVYQRLESRLDDTFVQAGSGFGYSWPSNMPVLQIDHIFLGKGAVAQNCFVPSGLASDHRPMVVDVSLVGRPRP